MKPVVSRINLQSTRIRGSTRVGLHPHSFASVWRLYLYIFDVDRMHSDIYNFNSDLAFFFVELAFKTQTHQYSLLHTLLVGLCLPTIGAMGKVKTDDGQNNGKQRCAPSELVGR